MKEEDMAGHFDSKVTHWDADASRLACAADIVRAVERKWPTGSSVKLLDYGAGTGLCTLALAPRCASVLAMDISSGMLTRLEEKAKSAGMEHLKTLQHDLSAAPFEGERFDVILCSMTLHHVANIDLLLRRFHAMLKPAGILFIADLEQEDGTFHDHFAGVHHHGFSRDFLIRSMMNTGFSMVSMNTVHQIRKTRESGVREYPVFLFTIKCPVIAKKNTLYSAVRPDN